jgi:hypothetical protein
MCSPATYRSRFVRIGPVLTCRTRHRRHGSIRSCRLRHRLPLGNERHERQSVAELSRRGVERRHSESRPPLALPDRPNVKSGIDGAGFHLSVMTLANPGHRRTPESQRYAADAPLRARGPLPRHLVHGIRQRISPGGRGLPRAANHDTGFHRRVVEVWGRGRERLEQVLDQHRISASSFRKDAVRKRIAQPVFGSGSSGCAGRRRIRRGPGALCRGVATPGSLCHARGSTSCRVGRIGGNHVGSQPIASMKAGCSACYRRRSEVLHKCSTRFIRAIAAVMWIAPGERPVWECRRHGASPRPATRYMPPAQVVVDALAGARLQQIGHKVHHGAVGVELRRCVAGVVGELLDEVLVAVAQLVLGTPPGSGCAAKCSISS